MKKLRKWMKSMKKNTDLNLEFYFFTLLSLLTEFNWFVIARSSRTNKGSDREA